jgi:probable rRNA maturation factor
MTKKAGQAVQFHYLAGTFYFPARTHLKKFLLRLFKEEGFVVSHINYIFCNDEYLHQINKQFLRHDTYTDIITFQLSEPKAAVLSDIYISTQRVRENAKELGYDFLTELHRVILHGALHLCGFDDKSEDEIKAMRNRENYYLARLSVSRRTVSKRN